MGRFHSITPSLHHSIAPSFLHFPLGIWKSGGGGGAGRSSHMKRQGMLAWKLEFNSYGGLSWTLPELHYTPAMHVFLYAGVYCNKLSKKGFWLWLSIVWETQKLTRYQSEELSYLTRAKVYAYNLEQILFIEIAKLKKFSTPKTYLFYYLRA